MLRLSKHDTVRETYYVQDDKVVCLADQLNLNRIIMERELQKIGLSEKESKVYLAALELGQASVQNIAKLAGVNRATAYSVLASLIEKGLCATAEQNGKTLYASGAPEALLSIFEIKKKEIEEMKNYFERILPDLRSIHNRMKDKSVVKFFEGKQGLLNCLDEFYQERGAKSEPVRMIYNRDLLESLFTDAERQKYRQIRLRQGAKTKVLYNWQAGELKSTADGMRLKVDDRKAFFHCDISIHGNLMKISPLREKLSAILIRDKEIARTFKALFDLAWDAAASEIVNK
ncbi:helix-turn-helix domain-containing protein [Candidatus Falkowbacteria bacterium]|nr:helix-turn-helix domain-containing protein [Candidatus Falkowbacteria bacterium]